jgi:hypothetical protein
VHIVHASVTPVCREGILSNIAATYKDAEELVEMSDEQTDFCEDRNTTN